MTDKEKPRDPLGPRIGIPKPTERPVLIQKLHYKEPEPKNGSSDER